MAHAGAAVQARTSPLKVNTAHHSGDSATTDLGALLGQGTFDAGTAVVAAAVGVNATDLFEQAEHLT